MKKFFSLFFITLTLSFKTFSANTDFNLSEALPPRNQQEASVNLTFDRVPIVDLIQAYYSDIQKKSFVITSDVYEIKDQVGIVYSSKKLSDMRKIFISVLRGAGIDVIAHDDVDIIVKHKPKEENFDVFVYHPLNRDMQYFSDLLSTVFKRGKFSFQRAVSKPPSQTIESNQSVQKPVDTGTSAYSMLSKNFDVLIFNGPIDEVKKLKELLLQLDLPEGQINVSAYVYEYQTSKSNTSGIAAIAQIIGGKTNLNMNFGSAPSANYLSISSSGNSGNLSLIAQNLSTGGRFKVVSRPYVRVKSGATARFNSGDEVPVLGSAQLDKNGNPIQSVEYKPSGVILDVAATVRESIVDLNLSQQLSNFVPTQNGVNNSPTLTKREVRSNFTVTPGEVIVVGGLVVTNEKNDKSKLFDWIPFMTSATDSATEIIVLLQVDKIQ